MNHRHLRFRHRVSRMRLTPIVLLSVAFFSVIFFSTGTLALGDYLGDLPSRPAACQTCHLAQDPQIDPAALNPFGQEASATLIFVAGTTAFVDWSRIFNIDSDGDGQTNGQELGDPCGEWTRDAASVPRAYALSLPGEEDDVSTLPEVGCSSDERPYETPSPRIYDPGVGGPAFDEGTTRSFGCLGPSSQVRVPSSDSIVFGVLLVWLAFCRRARSRA